MQRFDTSLIHHARLTEGPRPAVPLLLRPIETNAFTPCKRMASISTCPVTNSLVLGEVDPALMSGALEPFVVGDILLERRPELPRQLEPGEQLDWGLTLWGRPPAGRVGARLSHWPVTAPAVRQPRHRRAHHGRVDRDRNARPTLVSRHQMLGERRTHAVSWTPGGFKPRLGRSSRAALCR
jgi:hypothetical protein